MSYIISSLETLNMIFNALLSRLRIITYLDIQRNLLLCSVSTLPMLSNLFPTLNHILINLHVDPFADFLGDISIEPLVLILTTKHLSVLDE